MGTEAEYDKEIAPALADVARRCDELGMSMICRVEWEDGEAGITRIGISETSSIGQKLAYIAVHCRGNLDNLIISAFKNFDCSKTLVGRMMSSGQ